MSPGKQSVSIYLTVFGNYTYLLSLISHNSYLLIKGGEINKLLRAVNKPVDCPSVILEIVFKLKTVILELVFLIWLLLFPKRIATV